MPPKKKQKLDGGEGSRGSPLVTAPLGGSSTTPLSGGHPRNAPEDTVAPLFSIPPSWETCTLGEACDRGGGDVQTGPFGSQLHAADYVPVGIPSIMPMNIGDNRLSEEGIARISVKDAARLTKYLVREGDIVYSRRGDVERRALIRKHEHGWLCGTGCLRIRFGDGHVEPTFAAFYLGHPAVRAWIVRHAQGATMPNLNTSILSALPMVLPPISEQKEIAIILGSLDDKIENNRRMNETLEAMARALFKDWFVDFGPVRAKMEGREPPGLTAEVAGLFPEDVDENSTPISWSAARVGDLVKQTGASVQVTDLVEDEPYFGLEHLPRRSIALDNWGTANEVESGKRRFPAGCILFGKLRPNFHKVGIAPIGGVCSTDILSLAPISEDDFGIALSVLFSDDFVTYATRLADGAKMPRVNWKDLAKYPMVKPSRNVSAAFTKLLEPMTFKIKSNIFENRELVRIRNLLLPKLLSGEIRTQEAEGLLV